MVTKYWVIHYSVGRNTALAILSLEARVKELSKNIAFFFFWKRAARYLSCLNYYFNRRQDYSRIKATSLSTFFGKNNDINRDKRNVRSIVLCFFLPHLDCNFYDLRAGFDSFISSLLCRKPNVKNETNLLLGKKKR